jgi:hypothetical protein
VVDMKEYLIVGDTKNHKDCLIYRCGNSREDAEKVFDRLLNNPNNNDKFVSKGHFNIRIEETNSSDCWWNDMRD